ncbi:MAG: hypothetical protein NUV98_05590 [Candidatus Roizmanbacteria bacterium]|nr:hypothetical protein [Candidatus Roizmanbacteria bacterium]
MGRKELSKQELAQEYALLAGQVHERWQEYKSMTGYPIDPVDLDFVNHRVLYAEGPTWQRRRDAYDMTALYRGVPRIFEQIETEAQFTGQYPEGYEPGRHALLPRTAVCLFRRQVLHWYAGEEVGSGVTLYDVRASLQRQFYMHYANYQRSRPHPNRWHVESVPQLYQLHQVVAEAIRLDPTIDYKPAESEDFLKWGPFLANITRIEDE